MLTLTFEIRFDSNYHVGAGYGKGFNVDSALLREADDTLVLRGSALAGLLRDGAFRLLNLPPLDKHNREERLGRLFGTPKQIKHWRISSARLAEICFDDSQAVQRVRIDPCTRKAEQGKLFSQEEGVAGQRFFFSIACPYDDEVALDEAAFLVASARNVRQLGRSRRRGLGECTIHLTDVSGTYKTSSKPAGQSWEDWFLERFDQAWMQGSPKDRVSVETSIQSDVQTIDVPEGSAIRVRIIVRLDEPLLVSQRASAGNQYETRPFIPGSVLIGALAGLAAEHCDLRDLSIYEDFIKLFLRGGVKFSMLYPGYFKSNKLYPTIPAPLGLMTCSVVPFQDGSEGHGVYSAVGHAECQHNKCRSRLEPVDGFLILRKKQPHTLNTQLTSELHIRIDEKTQRVAKRDLYGYSAMSAGQYFVGEIICANEAIWQRLKEMTGISEETPFKCWLGKARSRGYGHVTVWMEGGDESPHTWIQMPLDQRVIDPTQIFSLTLLTDTIIANSWGQQATGFKENWLESILGGGVNILDAYAQTKVVDRFNSTLGLPRWRDTTLTAGSVAWIHLTNPPLDWAEQMAKLEQEGIGLRRNEGFGRIAFNHPVFDQRQKLTDSAIWLDDRMKPGSRQIPDRFMEEWETKLGELLPQEQRLDASFQALARWLHTYSDKSPQKLTKQLSSMTDPEKAFFGQPDKDLIVEIGETEYGKRHKNNRFIEKGKDNIGAIIKALEYLKKEDRKYWRKGLERLAEWIAIASRDETKGGIQ